MDQKRTGWNEHIIDNAIALVAWPLTTCAAIPAAGEVGISQKVILNSEDTDTHANVQESHEAVGPICVAHGRSFLKCCFPLPPALGVFAWPAHRRELCDDRTVRSIPNAAIGS